MNKSNTQIMRSNIQIMRSTFLTSTPLIKVKDKDDGECYVVGDSPHDQFILGKDGGLHYYNLQCSESTEFGAYKFDLEEAPFDYMDKTFEKVDFLDLMDLDADRLNLTEDESYIKLRYYIKLLFDKAIEDKELEKIGKLSKILQKHFEEEFGE